MFRHELAQGRVHVPGHKPGIATDIHMRAVLQPAPQLGAVLQQAVLHIDLLRLVTRERGAQAHMPAGLPGLHLFAVIEVAGGMLLTEEQPVAPLGPTYLALFKEGAEGGDTGTRADHDDGHPVVLGQAEVLRWLGKYPHLQRRCPVREEARTDALALAMAHDGHGQVHLAGMSPGAGADRVQARLQGFEQRQPVAQRQGLGVFAQHVGQLAAPQPFLEFVLALWQQQALQVGSVLAEGFELLAADLGDVQVPLQRGSQGHWGMALEFDLGLAFQLHQHEQLVDQLRAIVRPYTQGIAGLIAQIAARQVEDQLASLLG